MGWRDLLFFCFITKLEENFFATGLFFLLPESKTSTWTVSWQTQGSPSDHLTLGHTVAVSGKSNHMSS